MQDPSNVLQGAKQLDPYTRLTLFNNWTECGISGQCMGHTSTRANTHIQTHACTYTRSHARAHAHTHTHTHTHTQTHTHTHKHTHKHTPLPIWVDTSHLLASCNYTIPTVNTPTAGRRGATLSATYLGGTSRLLASHNYNTQTTGRRGATLSATYLGGHLTFTSII